MRIPPHPWDPGFNCSFAVRLLFPLLFHLQRLLFHLCPRHPARLPDLAVSPSLAPWFPLSQSALLCPTSLTAGLGGGCGSFPVLVQWPCLTVFGQVTDVRITWKDKLQYKKIPFSDVCGKCVRPCLPSSAFLFPVLLICYY